MTLRLKTLLIMGVLLVGLVSILYLALSTILADGFKRVEETSIRKDVERALKTVANDLANLSSTARDYAEWDDTYAFVQDRNPDYIEANLVDSTFSELKINVFMLFDDAGQLVFAKGFDLDDAVVTPVTEGLLSYFQPGSAFLYHPDLQTRYSGILLLPEGPLLMAACPILTSQNKGPIHGTLVLGRYLDALKVQQLADLTNLTLTIRRLDDPQLPDDVRAIQGQFSDPATIVVQTLGDETIAGYSQITDAFGKPVLLLRVVVARDVYRQGQLSLTYLLFSLLTLGLMFSLITLWLLERLVLAPVLRLSAEVGSVTRQEDPALRVTVPGKDELGKLAVALNGMLEALEVSQRRLQESEVRYRAVVQQSVEGIVVADAATKQILEANLAFQRLLGYSGEDLRCLTLYEVDTLNREAIDWTVEAIMESGQSLLGERQFRCKDGSLIDVEISANVLWLSGQRVVSMLVRHIGERKRAQAEILRLNARLQRRAEELSALNQVGRSMAAVLELPDLLQLVQVEAMNLLAADAAAIFLYEPATALLTCVAAHGPGEAEMVGRRIPDRVGLAGWVAQHQQTALVTQVADDPRFQELLPFMEWYRGRSVLSVPLLFNAVVSGVIEVVSQDRQLFDAHDQELLEAIAAAAAIAVNNAQLYTNLQLALRQEQTMRAQLIQAGKLSAMGRMVASVAHEFNNPLQTIKNCLFLVQQDIGPALAENEFMHTATSEIQRLSDLVTQLRAVYRTPAVEQRQPLDLVQTLDVVHTLMLPHLDKHRVSWEISLPAVPLQVVGIADQLKQVFLNIALNAVDAMQPGGGVLTVAFVLSDAGDSAGVVFRDTGPGLAPEVLANLFEPFFTTREGGMGLGLAISYDIVQSHGGRIEVTSPPGAGAQFTVWLPLASPDG